MNFEETGSRMHYGEGKCYLCPTFSPVFPLLHSSFLSLVPFSSLSFLILQTVYFNLNNFFFSIYEYMSKEGVVNAIWTR